MNKTLHNTRPNTSNKWNKIGGRNETEQGKMGSCRSACLLELELRNLGAGETKNKYNRVTGTIYVQTHAYTYTNILRRPPWAQRLSLRPTRPHCLRCFARFFARGEPSWRRYPCLRFRTWRAKLTPLPCRTLTRLTTIIKARTAAFNTLACGQQ